MTIEFEVEGKQYKGGKLNAFQQFYVVKRLAPLLGSLAGKAGGLKISMFLDAIGKVPDEDIEFVVKTALGVVYRKQGEATPWARVVNDQGALMFDDIGLLEMSEIAYHVLNDNLSSFFAGVARRGWVSPV